MLSSRQLRAALWRALIHSASVVATLVEAAESVARGDPTVHLRVLLRAFVGPRHSPDLTLLNIFAAVDP